MRSGQPEVTPTDHRVIRRRVEVGPLHRTDETVLIVGGELGATEVVPSTDSVIWLEAASEPDAVSRAVRSATGDKVQSRTCATTIEAREHKILHARPAVGGLNHCITNSATHVVVRHSKGCVYNLTEARRIVTRRSLVLKGSRADLNCRASTDWLISAAEVRDQLAATDERRLAGVVHAAQRCGSRTNLEHKSRAVQRVWNTKRTGFEEIQTSCTCSGVEEHVACWQRTGRSTCTYGEHAASTSAAVNGRPARVGVAVATEVNGCCVVSHRQHSRARDRPVDDEGIASKSPHCAAAASDRDTAICTERHRVTGRVKNAAVVKRDLIRDERLAGRAERSIRTNADTARVRYELAGEVRVVVIE